MLWCVDEDVLAYYKISSILDFSGWWLIRLRELTTRCRHHPLLAISCWVSSFKAKPSMTCHVSCRCKGFPMLRGGRHGSSRVQRGQWTLQHCPAELRRQDDQIDMYCCCFMLPTQFQSKGFLDVRPGYRLPGDRSESWPAEILGQRAPRLTIFFWGGKTVSFWFLLVLVLWIWESSVFWRLKVLDVWWRRWDSRCSMMCIWELQILEMFFARDESL